MGKSFASAGQSAHLLYGQTQKDLLDDGLVNELEAPNTTAQPLEVELIKPGKVFDSAQFDIELDLIADIDRMFTVDWLFGRYGRRGHSGRVKVGLR